MGGRYSPSLSTILFPLQNLGAEVPKAGTIQRGIAARPWATADEAIAAIELGGPKLTPAEKAAIRARYTPQLTRTNLRAAYA